MNPVATMPAPMRIFNQTTESSRREDGHDLDDWFQAESEITQTKLKAAAA
jgi:hypothetical protein